MNLKEQKLWQKAQQLFTEKRYRASIQALIKLHKLLKNTHSESLFLLAESYYQVGQLNQSNNALNKLNKPFIDSVLVLNLRGRIALSHGNLVSALEFFEANVAQDPTLKNTFAIKALIDLLMNFNLCQEAIPYLIKIKSLEENTYYSLTKLIKAYSYIGKRKKAEEAANELITRIVMSGQYELLAHALLCAKENGLNNLFNRGVENYLKQLMDNGGACLLIEKNYIDKEYEKVIEGVSKLQLKDSYYLNKVANSYFMLNHLDKAWEFLQLSKQVKLQESKPSKLLSIPHFLKKVENQEKSSVDSKDNTPQIVFMLGFPRSGTTLLETALDAKKQVLALGEESTLLFIASFTKSKFGKDLFEDTGKLTCEELNEIRKAYKNFICRLTGKQSLESELIILDKNPHLTPYIPVLSKIFPEAKFIIPLRHPMDTCFSIYRQNFIDTELNNRLITLDNIFATYRDTFELWDYYKRHLDINYCEVKYEDVVANFDITLQTVCTFIGLEFSDEVKKFHDFAQNKKHVRSASKDQVTQPLYKSSVNAWHAYREYLEPYKHYVLTVAERYGYDID